MKRLLVLLLFAAACTNEQASSPRPSSASEELKQVRAELDEERRRSDLQRAYIEDVTATINAVHGKLDTITPLERSIRAAQRDAEGGAPMTPTQREQLLQSIDTIRKQLEWDAQALAQYRTRSAPFEQKIGALEETIVRLQTAVEQKTQEISSLHESVERMTRQVEVLREQRARDQREIERANAELETRNQEITDLTVRLNEVRYIVGDIQALVKRGVLRQNRRFLRRAETALAVDPDRSQFAVADSRTLREIAVAAPSARVKIFPARPAGSYRLVAKSATSSVLAIDDPTVFWNVPYAVIAFEKR